MILLKVPIEPNDFPVTDVIGHRFALLSAFIIPGTKLA